ncbi:MAG: YicC family protein [Deltaproteobacteria bacterium]|nr:YicC family protein [Deltaproteobacteria bacterium]
MLKSMTAYGRAESAKSDLEYIVEIRSVNHRYREIVLKLPQSLLPLEEMARSLVSERVKRGRIDISIQLKDNGEKGLMLALNLPVVRAYADIFNALRKELGSKKPLDLALFSQIKDAIIIKQYGVDPERAEPDLRDVIGAALDSWEAMRINEGKAIEKDFLERLNKIRGYINAIRQRAEQALKENRDKLIIKINKMIKSIEINEDRLMQEIAFMAEKTDVTEELIRIESHVEQFTNYMAQDDVVGRRLDFLLQEINREVNTIGSKAADSLISHLVVEIKAELEKLREQTQNVE